MTEPALIHTHVDRDDATSLLVKDVMVSRPKTLPADERPWHKGYSGTEKLPEKTARKQDKERKQAEHLGELARHWAPANDPIIDRIVYELYQLSDVEIERVEGHFAGGISKAA